MLDRNEEFSNKPLTRGNEEENGAAQVLRTRDFSGKGTERWSGFPDMKGGRRGVNKKKLEADYGPEARMRIKPE